MPHDVIYECVDDVQLLDVRREQGASSPTGCIGIWHFFDDV
jgi:hypothetical protein